MNIDNLLQHAIENSLGIFRTFELTAMLLPNIYIYIYIHMNHVGMRSLYIRKFFNSLH